MNSKYYLAIVIFTLLLVSSIGNSVINYNSSLGIMQKQLKEQALPLSVANIYKEMQKNIIKPYLTSSMMANDTFLLQWLENDEHSVSKVTEYLKKIQNEYGMLATFLVSEKTKNYYTHNGFLEKISPDNRDNKWYFEFKNLDKDHEINIDLNTKITSVPIMFINFKMFNKQSEYLGATGVGIEVSYINNLLHTYESKYKLKASFLDKDGNYIMTHDSHKDCLDDVPELSSQKESILSKASYMSSYMSKGSERLVHSTYVKELDIYLIVEAKLSDFTQDIEDTFKMNILLSLLLTFFIGFVLINRIRVYNEELETLAKCDTLTSLLNRRSFEEQFSYHLSLSKRKNETLSLIFIDVDNFKKINDQYGHHIGDQVLEEFSNILKENFRKTDCISRWGGEEFVVLLVDTSLDDALKLAKKIRLLTESSQELYTLLNKPVTISSGVTEVKDEDTQDSVITRADTAMYNAKQNGKNRVEFL